MASFNFDQKKISEEFIYAMDNFSRSLDKPSILLSGPTGSGKSTLCNLVFKKQICKVGQGSPITKGISKVTDENCGVIVYDSEGYELGAKLNNETDSEGKQDYYKLIFDFIDIQDLRGKPVDVIWYCISAPSARITDTDITIISEFNKRRKPCAVILTQVDVASEEDCDALKSTLKEKLGESVEIFESSTDENIQIDKGLNELHKWTEEHLDKSRKDAFIYASNRDLEAKSELCRSYIMYGALGAGAAALNPIPMSDALIITPIQMAMIGKIAATWELFSIRDAVKGLLLEVIVQNLGKTLAGNIIKLVPGLGSWVGGAINATVAASITYGLGYAFNEVCEKIKKASMEGKSVDLSSYFNSDFVKAIEKYIEVFRKNKDLMKDIKNFKNS